MQSLVIVPFPLRSGRIALRLLNVLPVGELAVMVLGFAALAMAG